jgi:hypothetical protein
MTKKAPLKPCLYPLGRFDLVKGAACYVEMTPVDAGGIAHADAVQIVHVK